MSQALLAELDGATEWLNSEPLTAAGLDGNVVAVQFCTYSCVNWIRTLPYVRAWVRAYRETRPGGRRGTRPRVRLRARARGRG